MKTQRCSALRDQKRLCTQLVGSHGLACGKLEMLLVDSGWEQSQTQTGKNLCPEREAQLKYVTQTWGETFDQIHHEQINVGIVDAPPPLTQPPYECVSIVVFKLSSCCFFKSFDSNICKEIFFVHIFCVFTFSFAALYWIVVRCIYCMIYWCENVRFILSFSIIFFYGQLCILWTEWLVPFLCGKFIVTARGSQMFPASFCAKISFIHFVTVLQLL